RTSVRIGGETLYADRFGRLQLCPNRFPVSVELNKNGYESTSLDIAVAGETTAYMLPAFDGDNVVTIIGHRPEEPSAVAVSSAEAAAVAPMGGDPLQVTKSL